uniref:Uncharacterized protein n=1 Tax=Timema monikensis TaxID=170555 RepID=A0A7R9HME8_9NEOP|nr:unnamed protein product [Timema monikensis]
MVMLKLELHPGESKEDKLPIELRYPIILQYKYNQLRGVVVSSPDYEARGTGLTSWLVPSVFFPKDELLQQLPRFGTPISPRSSSCQLVFLMMHMTTVVLAAAYSAALVSSLSVKNTMTPFNSVQGLLDDESYSLEVTKYSAEYSMFQVMDIHQLDIGLLFKAHSSTSRVGYAAGTALAVAGRDNNIACLCNYEIVASGLIGVFSTTCFINKGERKNMSHPVREGVVGGGSIIALANPNLRHVGISRERSCTVHLLVVGFGLGVCRGSEHQNAIFYQKLSECFYMAVEKHGSGMGAIAVLELLWMDGVMEYFSDREKVLEGRDVRIMSTWRAPYESYGSGGEYMVMTYAWDGNSGQESKFWNGKIVFNANISGPECDDKPQSVDQHLQSL